MRSPADRSSSNKPFHLPPDRATAGSEARRQVNGSVGQIYRGNPSVSDDVRTCDQCGGDIIFRWMGFGVVPIHLSGG